MRYLIVVIIILFSTQLFPNNGMIIGHIFDRDSVPLAGTNVTILGTTMGAESNENGFYFIEPVKEGVYQVKAQFVGYNSRSKIVIVKSEEKSRVDFFLDTNEFILPETVLIAEKDIINPKYEKLCFRGVYYRQKYKKIYIFNKELPKTHLDLSVGFCEKFYYNLWSIFN